MKPNWILEMLTLDETARELGLAPNTLRDLIRRGEIVPIMVGARPRFARWMLVIWQAKRAKLLDVPRIRELFNFVETS